MTHIETMKQALEALQDPLSPTKRMNAITSLRQAIATEESSATQKPVAFITNRRQRMNVEIKPDAFVWMPTTTDWEIPLYTHPQPKAEQEPEKEELFEALVAMQDIMWAEAGVRSDGVDKLIARYRAAHGIKGEA